MLNRLFGPYDCLMADSALIRTRKEMKEGRERESETRARKEMEKRCGLFGYRGSRAQAARHHTDR